jgi:branched-chain amino acid transport system ATP-binding protein
MTDTPPPPLLDVVGVTALYGGVILALDGVSLAVARGECHAVLGANGAGKSTLLKAISGMLADDGGSLIRGHILFDGLNITHQPAVKRYRRGIVHVLEGRRVLPHLSVHRNLLAGANRLSRRAAHDAVEQAYEQIPALGRVRNHSAGHLSGGQQQLLVIARAIVAQPALLLIDEPSLGLAPKMAEDVYDTLARLVSPELTMVIVEQNVNLARQVADRATVLELGRVASQRHGRGAVTPDDLVASYLGRETTATADLPLRPPRRSLWARP